MTHFFLSVYTQNKSLLMLVNSNSITLLQLIFDDSTSNNSDCFIETKLTKFTILFIEQTIENMSAP